MVSTCRTQKLPDVKRWLFIVAEIGISLLQNNRFYSRSGVGPEDLNPNRLVGGVDESAPKPRLENH